MIVAVCILAKDEERNIAAVLKQLSQQTLLTDKAAEIHVHVVANGCTDSTVAIARSCASAFVGNAAKFKVHDLKKGGKSRTWNRAVHYLVADDVTYFIFLDADIHFTDSRVCSELIRALEEKAEMQVCAGFPIKNIQVKEHRSVLNRFSLLISRDTRFIDAISGQLYAARASALKNVWLPDATPGEDGFLNAMIHTRNFTEEPAPGRIVGHYRPTHYYEALGPISFVHHERRLIIGTLINRWIFEHLWSLKLSSEAGTLIRDWNAEDPKWVERLIRERVGTKFWLIPNSILFGRLRANHALPLRKRIVTLPLRFAASLITLPPAILANRRLKKSGAASDW